MADYSTMLLPCPREKARHIHQREQRRAEAVAAADKARRLVGGVDIQTAGANAGLIGDDAHRVPVDARIAGDDILCKAL